MLFRGELVDMHGRGTTVALLVAELAGGKVRLLLLLLLLDVTVLLGSELSEGVVVLGGDLLFGFSFELFFF